MLTLCLLSDCRTVPTEDEILVPETLLKKRKSQEKSREERSAELEKKKKVGPKLYYYHFSAVAIVCDLCGDEDDTTNPATRPYGRCCRILINHLSGLSQP